MPETTTSYRAYIGSPAAWAYGSDYIVGVAAAIVEEWQYERRKLGQEPDAGRLIRSRKGWLIVVQKPLGELRGETVSAWAPAYPGADWLGLYESEVAALADLDCVAGAEGVAVPSARPLP